MAVGDTIGDGGTTWIICDSQAVATSTQAGLMSAADKKALDVLKQNSVSGGSSQTISGGGGGGVVDLQPASATELGGVKIDEGSGLTIDSNGFLRLEGGTIGSDTSIYELPKATTTSLGCIKVGTGLSINNGTLSVSSGVILNTVASTVEGAMWYRK